MPYDVHLKNENNFRILFFSIFMLLGAGIAAESKTNEGRIDAVAADEDFVFIFEFKLDKSKEAALDQINERDCCRRYMNSGKKSSSPGSISTWNAGRFWTGPAKRRNTTISESPWTDNKKTRGGYPPLAGCLLTLVNVRIYRNSFAERD